MCCKQRYPSAADAKRSLAVFRRKGKGFYGSRQHQVYRCRECACYHIGHGQHT